MTGTRIVLETVQPLLSEYGFKKRAGDIFTIELGEGVLGWLGLNRATNHHPSGEIEINPVIGIRHQGVERLVSELRDEKFHQYQPPTISTPLGYLLPEARYRAWVFTSQGADIVAAEMVGAIASYGIPFMKTMANLNAICQKLEAGLGFEHQLVYRRPIARFLSGDEVQARKILDGLLATFDGRKDMAADEFRLFYTRFMSRFPLVH